MNTSLNFAETVDCLVHAELSDTYGEPGSRSGDSFELEKARLYVIPESTTAGTMSSCIALLDEDENPYRLLRRTRHHLPIVAGCLVATGWCAPFRLDDDADACPPSSHPSRQRVRLCVAITESGIASVLRRSDQPDIVHSLPSRGMGDLPDVLDAWWRLSRNPES